MEWTGLKFSPDGKTILVSTNGSMIKLIDAFSGSCLQTFTVSLPINTFQACRKRGAGGHLPSVFLADQLTLSQPGGAQCVELKLRWQFSVHTSTCPEI